LLVSFVRFFVRRFNLIIQLLLKISGALFICPCKLVVV
jgi:hypothetical protein